MAKDKVEQRNIHTSREAWLKAAADALRPYFAECGYPLPEKIRYGMAFTSQGRKGKITGQCIFPEASADKHHEIIIRFDRDDAGEVLDVLAHQLVQAVTAMPL